MKQLLRAGFAFYLLAIMLITGCAAEPQDSMVQAKPWEGWPQIEQGVVEAEQLHITTWSSGRCEATSENTMIEVENGYYYAYQEYLFYADKADLSNWVLVCAKPNCDHSPHRRCSAALNSQRILKYNGRICTTVWSVLYPELYATQGSGDLLVSMAADGTDLRLEYVFEEALKDGLSNSFSFLLSDQWIYSYTETDTAGNLTGYLYRVTEDGPQLIRKQEGAAGASVLTMTGVAYGVTPFWSELLDDSGELRFFHYFQNGELIPLDLSLLPSWGCYVSNGIARGFDHREGYYYDKNLETGEIIPLADAQIENSFGCVVLPNCILESTLLRSFSTEFRDPDTPNTMKIFDGKHWRDVSLPAELQQARSNDYLEIIAVTSDRILLSFRNTNTYTYQTGYLSEIYSISLNEENLQVKHCAQISVPTQE